jgi:uncharacterized membrane protein YkvA (DUF1232 family)
MEQVFDVLKLMLALGAGLLLAFMVLLALPKSQLRGFLLQVVGWALAVFCGVYVVSPIDVIPDVIPVVGWIDDVGAAVVGVTSAVMAINAKNSK